VQRPRLPQAAALNRRRVHPRTTMAVDRDRHSEK